MSQINVIVMEGNLASDAVVRHFGEKGIETKFTIANNYGFGDYEKKTFMVCKLYGPRGEKLAEYLTKGIKLTVVGPIHVDVYDKDGEKKYLTYIKVDELSLGPKKTSNSEPRQQKKDEYSGEKFNDDIPF